MCGLTGLWSPGLDDERLRASVERMMTPIAHRGPDDSGSWTEPAAGVALGFRRLAIIDLSELGHQPMRSATGRFTIIFNGEVYNFADLRAELEKQGARFRGHSDTEVILAAFEAWGIAAAVTRFVGMFAIAVWDAQNHTLSLIRDRLGIKPMYYYAERGYLSFGSELKSLVAGPRFTKDVDRDALAAFLRYLYVPSPMVIWRGARKLPPGCILTVTDPSAALPEPVPYWSLSDVAKKGLSDLFTGSDEAAVDELERLLVDAVRLRMIADVPVGALLSGGADSSTVVALMKATHSGPVRTYSIAFDDPAHDEAAFAAKVAQHLGTEHTQMLVTGAEALDVVPRLPDMFDEPLADPSQIPTYLVCALARREVTVALTGDGGDELLAGYNRYVHGARTFARINVMPGVVRKLVAAGIQGVGPNTWDRAFATIEPLLRRDEPLRLPGEKLHKVGRLLASASDEDMYRSLVSAWENPEKLVPGSREPRDAIASAFALKPLPALLNRMLLADQQVYLPDDLLAKVDRASMAVSLEVRVPLLDHRVVEFSWRLPERLKVRANGGKWALRQVLYRHVPQALVDRPKVGFTVPVDEWLRGPLKSWAEELLDAPGGASEYLDLSLVREEWQALQARRAPTGLRLWAVLMFLAWFRRWVDSPAD